MSAPDWSVGQLVCGRYTIKAVLRRGDRSSTFASALGEPPRDVVLRVVGKEDAAKLDPFAAQVADLGALPAPQVLRVLEVATDDDSGARFVASEHSRHPSLASLIGLGALTVGEAITFANEVARIVDAAHDKRVLHGGLKPTNVFVAEMLKSGVEISDFALPALDDTFESKRWLSPEQLEGAPATAASDVFSTALLVFHAFTGKHYWSATTLDELRAEIDAPFVAPWKRADEHGVTLPPEMDEVFVKALSRAPADRPRRVADFARALDAAPKNVVSVPPPPMDLVASLAATESAASAPVATEAPIVPDVIVPVAPAAPALAAPAEPSPQVPAAALPAPEDAPLVPPEEARRSRIIVASVLGGAVAILLLALLVSGVRHLRSGLAPAASASAAASTAATVADTAPPPPPPPPAQTSETPPPPVEVDAAPPAPALGPGESELLVVCEPACNVVMVDRKSMTGVQDPMKTTPGKHGVGVSAPGYFGDWKLVETKAGERATVTFILTKKPPKPATTKPPPKHR